MTQKEINNYNRLCAEFLGYELITPDKRRNPDEWKHSYWEHKNKANVHTSKKVLGRDEFLLFHSDWNWIMEVLCKIEEIHHTVISQGITGHYININREDVNIMTATLDNPSKFMGVDKTKKKAVVQAINQFLIWYNENNNNRQS